MAIQVGIDAGDTITINLADMQTLHSASTPSTSPRRMTTPPSPLSIRRRTPSTTSAPWAFQNRLQAPQRHPELDREPLRRREPHPDVDVAFETADLTRNTILQQAATSVISSANLQPQLALSLLS